MACKGQAAAVTKKAFGDQFPYKAVTSSASACFSSQQCVSRTSDGRAARALAWVGAMLPQPTIANVSKAGVWAMKGSCDFNKYALYWQACT